MNTVNKAIDSVGSVCLSVFPHDNSRTIEAGVVKIWYDYDKLEVPRCCYHFGYTKIKG